MRIRIYATEFRTLFSADTFLCHVKFFQFWLIQAAMPCKTYASSFANSLFALYKVANVLHTLSIALSFGHINETDPCLLQFMNFLIIIKYCGLDNDEVREFFMPIC